MSGQEPLDASRICSGTYGKIYIDGKWHSEASECTADVDIDDKEILTCGSDWVGHKRGAKKGSGTLKGYKVTSQMIIQGFDRFELVTELDDPEAYGCERIRLKNCMATKVNLVNFKPGDVIEEETPFVFTGYDPLDLIEAN